MFDCDKVKKARSQKGLTMKQVGILANISESMYCLIESGKRRPSPEVAMAIGKVLKVDWTIFYK